MARQYKYQPVNSEAKECRVFELLPGLFDDDIVIVLHPHSLEDEHSIKYDAISYTWNDEQRCEKIYVRSCRAGEQRKDYLLATPNLLLALRHLRKINESQVLWADAICINQDDLTERGAQVALMARIFTSVAHLWIWLGPKADDSHLAIETMRRWYSKVEPNLIARGPANFNLREPIDDGDRWMIDNTKQLQFTSRRIESLRALFARSWYERLWVQQEVYLARGRATFVCGSSTISSEEFNGAVQSVMLRLTKSFERVNQKWWEERFPLLWDLSHSKYDESLPELVRRTQFTKCTDPRDKIYGVLGLLTPSDQGILKLLKPDYHIDVMALYERVSQLYVEATHRLDLLRFCASYSTSPSLPTWAVNWNIISRREAIDENYAAAFSLDTKIEVQDHVLHVRGIISTTITDTEPFDVSLASLTLEQAASIIRVLRDRFLDNHSVDAAYRCKRAIVLMLVEAEVHEHQDYIEKSKSVKGNRLTGHIDELNRIFEASDDVLPQIINAEMSGATEVPSWGYCEKSPSSQS